MVIWTRLESLLCFDGRRPWCLALNPSYPEHPPMDESYSDHCGGGIGGCGCAGGVNFADSVGGVDYVGGYGHHLPMESVYTASYPRCDLDWTDVLRDQPTSAECSPRPIPNFPGDRSGRICAPSVCLRTSRPDLLRISLKHSGIMEAAANMPAI